MQHAGATAVLVEQDAHVLGAIAVRDQLRPEAAQVVARLRADGYHVAMLTGDNRATALTLAADAGISDVHAELRPEDKARLVEELRTQRNTAMVGDGSTTHRPWPPPTWGSRWARWGPTWRSKPPTWH